MSVPFVRDFAFEYGRADAVSPRIRRIVCRNPGPFTFTGTGTYVVGRGEVAVIDPGPPDDTHLAAILKAVEGERVVAILITHSHADHSPLAGPLAEATGAPIYGRAPSPVALDPDAPVVEAGEDDGFRPDVEVAEGWRLSGPDWTIQAVPTPGHASNHVCYALLEENALFSGDHVMGWSTTVVSPPDGDMAAYFDSLRRLMDQGYDTLWPTHGPPVTEVAPFLQAYLDHRLEREAQITARLRAGDRTIAEMVPVLYAAVDARLWPAASRSVLAHLLGLERRGLAVREGPPELSAVWRLSEGEPA